MKKQTAVEWYWEKIKSHFEHDGDLLETATFTLAIAKKKEREQIEDAYIECWMMDGGNGNLKLQEANEYYNETYGGEQ